jgi:2-oxoglutarate dehydrogenase E1 component
MTTKSLLRHKLAVSSLAELTDGQFYNVIEEVDQLDSAKVNKVVLCCGKVYYDLLQKRRDEQLNHIAIVRIEQLYPFPKDEFKKAMAQFPHADRIVWCQEEPQNQGAWFASQHHIQECLKPEQKLSYAGRAFAAAPAAGSANLHAKQQEALVAQALND